MTCRTGKIPGDSTCSDFQKLRTIFSSSSEMMDGGVSRGPVSYIKNCPICGAQDGERIITRPDGHPVLLCRNCGVGWTTE
jgi:hypothetical protein